MAEQCAGKAEQCAGEAEQDANKPNVSEDKAVVSEDKAAGIAEKPAAVLTSYQVFFKEKFSELKADALRKHREGSESDTSFVCPTKAIVVEVGKQWYALRKDREGVAAFALRTGTNAPMAPLGTVGDGGVKKKRKSKKQRREEAAERAQHRAAKKARLRRPMTAYQFFFQEQVSQLRASSDAKSATDTQDPIDDSPGAAVGTADASQAVADPAENNAPASAPAPAPGLADPVDTSVERSASGTTATHEREADADTREVNSSSESGSGNEGVDMAETSVGDDGNASASASTNATGTGGRRSDKVLLQNEIVKEIGRRWRAIAPDELKRHQEQAKEAKAIWKAEQAKANLRAAQNAAQNAAKQRAAHAGAAVVAAAPVAAAAPASTDGTLSRPEPTSQAQFVLPQAQGVQLPSVTTNGTFASAPAALAQTAMAAAKELTANGVPPMPPSSYTSPCSISAVGVPHQLFVPEAAPAKPAGMPLGLFSTPFLGSSLLPAQTLAHAQEQQAQAQAFARAQLEAQLQHMNAQVQRVQAQIQATAQVHVPLQAQKQVPLQAHVAQAQMQQVAQAQAQVQQVAQVQAQAQARATNAGQFNSQSMDVALNRYQNIFVNANAAYTPARGQSATAAPNSMLSTISRARSFPGVARAFPGVASAAPGAPL